MAIDPESSTTRESLVSPRTRPAMRSLHSDTRSLVCDAAPKSDHLTPQTNRLEHPDARCHHYKDVQNSLYTSSHRNVSVDEPQNHSHNQQRQHNVYNRLDVPC